MEGVETIRTKTIPRWALVLTLCLLTACASHSGTPKPEPDAVQQYLLNRYPGLVFQFPPGSTSEDIAVQTTVNGQPTQFRVFGVNESFTDSLEAAVGELYQDSVTQHLKFRLEEFYSDTRLVKFGPTEVVFQSTIASTPPLSFQVKINGRSVSDDLEQVLVGKTLTLHYPAPVTTAGKSMTKVTLAGVLPEGSLVVIEEATEDELGVRLTGFVKAKSDTLGHIHVPVCSLLATPAGNVFGTPTAPVIMQASTALRLFPWPSEDEQSTDLASVLTTVREASVLQQLATRGDWALVLTDPDPWLVGYSPWGWVKLSQLRAFDAATSHQGWLRTGSWLYDGEDNPDLSHHTVISQPMRVTALLEQGDFLLIDPLTDKAFWTEASNLVTRNPFDRMPAELR